MTPEQMLKRSSTAIRIPYMYVSSLHYLLLTDEGELKPFDEAYNWRIQPSGSKPWMMGCIGFRNVFLFHLLRLST